MGAFLANGMTCALLMPTSLGSFHIYALAILWPLIAAGAYARLAKK